MRFKPCNVDADPRAIRPLTSHELDHVSGGGSKAGGGTEGGSPLGSKPGGITDGRTLLSSKPGGVGNGLL